MFKYLLLLFLLLACLAYAGYIRAAGSAGAQSADQFTSAYANAAKAEWPDATVSIKASLQVQIRRASGEEHMAFLDNAFDEYRANPDKMDAVIQAHLAAPTVVAEFADVGEREKVFAMVKPISYLATIAKQMAMLDVDSKPSPALSEVLNADMVIMYAFDSKQGMRMLMPDDLEKLKLKSGDLRPLAEKNMRRYFQSTPLQAMKMDSPRGSIYMVRVDGYYEASSILFDEFWTKERFPVPGEIVVFVVARDVVMVVGSEDEQALELAGSVAQKNFKELPYSISPHPFVRRGGSWERFEP